MKRKKGGNEAISGLWDVIISLLWSKYLHDVSLKLRMWELGSLGTV